MRVVFHDDGILAQFEGYDLLQKFDLPQYRKQYGRQRIDWTLEALGDEAERYRISKQADTSLLLYLFSPTELIAMLERMGYQVNEDQLKRTMEYEIAHSAHESSLSKIVQAGALARLDLKASWNLFQESQLIDFLPGEHKDTSEGIHIGAMGGTLQVLQHHYLGINFNGDALETDPALPEGLGRAEMTFFFLGTEIECRVTRSEVSLKSLHKGAEQVKVKYHQNTFILFPGKTVTFKINS
jgi:alpha,alpha-trehalase